MYSNISLVRSLSGLHDTTRITDSNIKGKILRADALIDSYIRQKYILPLPYHRFVIITFSGTGTASGTLDIIVGGVTYTINIADDMTATEAADLLRTAMIGNTNVQVDQLGSGQDVYLISLADSEHLAAANAQVASTGGTSSGITATVGNITDRYPPIIEHLSAEIAAGYLLLDNYGLEEEGTARDGNIRITGARSLLKQIQGVDVLEESLRITDEITGDVLPTRGLPTAQSYTSTVDAPEPSFSVNMKF